MLLFAFGNLLSVSHQLARLVFNVPCEFAMIDIVDVLGTRNDNVTKNVNKWNVNSKGVRASYDGRNSKQADIEHDSHHDLEALHANGVHANEVPENRFNMWIREHDYSFVDFYAPC